MVKRGGMLNRVYLTSFGNKEKLPHSFFLHIPRCGGTSVEHALKKIYPKAVGLKAEVSFRTTQALYPDGSFKENDFHMFKLRESLLLYNMGSHVPLVHGHFGFSEIAYQEFGNEYRFITVLRDPVERFLSLYFYNVGKPQSYGRIAMNLEDFVHSQEGLSQGCQYVKFIGGVVKDADYRSAKAIDRALGNLDKFSLVGTLERLDDFILSVQSLVGRSICIIHENKNPKPKSERDRVVSKKMRRVIHSLCGPDIEVYNHALRLCKI